jgi:hypothetical protein
VSLASVEAGALLKCMAISVELNSFKKTVLVANHLCNQHPRLFLPDLVHIKCFRQTVVCSTANMCSKGFGSSPHQKKEFTLAGELTCSDYVGS